MQHLETFTYKILLVARNLSDAGIINKYFLAAGGLEMDIESIPSGVVSKLQDKSYQACIVYVDEDFPAPLQLVKAVRNNSGSSKIPLLIITDEPWSQVTEYYDEGASFVAWDELDADLANECLHIIDAIIRFVERFRDRKGTF